MWGGYHYGDGPDMICNDCGGEVLGFEEGPICAACNGSSDWEGGDVLEVAPE